MKNFNRSLINLAVVGCIAIFSESVIASSYELEATGKDEAAALGNLKMAALRAEVQKTLSKDEMKQNAKLLRNEVFLKVNDFTHESGTPAYSTENNKVKVKGSIEVDSDKLLSVLGKAPLVKEGNDKASSSETKSEVQVAQNTTSNPVSSLPEEATSNTNSEKTELTDNQQESSVVVSENINDSQQTETAKQTATQTTQNIAINNSSEVNSDEQSSNSNVNATGESSGNSTNALLSSDGFETLKVVNIKTDKEQDEAFVKKVLRGIELKELTSELSNGANPNALSPGFIDKTKYDSLPLLYIYLKDKKNPELDIVKALINGGAFYNWESSDGKVSIAKLLFDTRNPNKELITYWLSLKPNLSRLKCADKKDGEFYNLAYLFVHQNFVNLSQDKKEQRLKEPFYSDTFSSLLDLGVDANYKQGWELLRLAYYYCGVDFAKTVLEHGASPNNEVTDHSLGAPLIFFALERNQLDFVKALVSHGADLTLKKNKNYFGVNAPLPPLPFYFSIYDHLVKQQLEPNLEIVKTLVEGGADINWSEERNSVVFSVRNTSNEFIKYYLSLKPDLSKYDLLDYYLRYYENKDTEVIRNMMALGVYPKDQSSAYSLLRKVIVSYPEYLNVILEGGADPNVKSENGEPVIFALTDKYNVEALKVLKEHGADLNALDKDGKSLLFKAIDAYKFNPEFICTLIDLGADVKIIVGKAQKTLLMYAIQNSPSSVDVVEKLIDAGVDLKAKDKDGGDAVVYAVLKKSIPVLKKLEEKGANIKESLNVKAPFKEGSGKDAKIVEMKLKDILKKTYKEAGDKVSPEAREFYEYLEKYF